MPERFQKHEKEIEDRKPKKDIGYIFKRISELSKKNSKSAKTSTTNPNQSGGGGAKSKGKK